MMPRKRFIILSLAVVVLGLISGCSTIPPYQRPLQGATGLERQEQYVEHSVSHRWWNGWTVNGMPVGMSMNYYSEFGDYYEASGDFKSSATIRKFSPWVWVGPTLGVAGLSVMLARDFESERNGNTNNGDVVAISAVVVGMVSMFEIDQWGLGHYFVPATKSFNEYLKHDLESIPYATKTSADNISETTQVDYSGGYFLKNRFRIGKYNIMGFTVQAVGEGITPTATVEAYDRINRTNVHLACDGSAWDKKHLILKLQDIVVGGVKTASIELDGNFLQENIAPVKEVGLDKNERVDFEGNIEVIYASGKMADFKDLKFIRVD